MKYRVYIGKPDGRHYTKRDHHFQGTAVSLGKAWDRLHWLIDIYNLNPYVTGRAVATDGIEKSLKAGDIGKEPIQVGTIDAGIAPPLGLDVFIHKVNL